MPDASSSPPAVPTWVAMAGYTVEKLHTNILACSLNSGKPAAKQLTAALWQLACGETIASGEIGTINAKAEVAVGSGRHSVVDLHVEFEVGQGKRTLAIEVKVDGSPDGGHLATMATSLRVDAQRQLVLLCLGSAQVCHLDGKEALHKLNLQPSHWSVKHILQLADLIEAASPAPGVTKDWLTELALEERRRTEAFADATLPTDWTYRGRVRDVYRYALAAAALAPDHGSWHVSDQPHGVVLTERSKHREIKVRSHTFVVYLEVAGCVLRVKAGSWEPSRDARAATKHLLAPIRAAMENHKFTVTNATAKKGQYVTLLKLDAHDTDLSREPFLHKLRRAYRAWGELTEFR